MADHRSLLAEIDPALRAQLTARSDRAGLTQLAGHLGAIAVTSALIWGQVPGWPVLMVAQGILLVFLFTPLHETTHGTPFRSAWLNRAVGAFCGVILMIPPTWFHFFHMAHHRWTQDPDRDPELAGGGLPETRAGILWAVTGLPMWRGLVQALVTQARGRCTDSYVPQARRSQVTREARAMLAVYGLVAASLLVSPLALWLWIGPMLLGQPFLRLYLMAEHGRCAFVANMLENSRTTLTNRALRWLAWNMPYHAEHHSFPTVPFHNLPALHRQMAPHLLETAPGYVAFHRRLFQRPNARSPRCSTKTQQP